MTGILNEDMKRVIREQRLGFVATVCPDGTPNLSPKGTTSVWDDDHLVFVDFRSPGTVANLRANPSIEINVVDPFVRKGYRFKGTAKVITGGETFDLIREFYKNQWVDVSARRGSPDARIKGFVLVEIKEAGPLISPSYDDPKANEKEIRAKWIHHFSLLNRAAGKARAK